MPDTKQTTQMHHWRAICLTDLQPDQEPIIKILNYATHPMALTGPVKAGDKTDGVVYTDAMGKTHTTSATTANYLTASWIGDDVDVLAPLVRIGEQVEIYQYSNSDKLFWKSTARDRHLRTADRWRLEAAAANGTGQTKTDNNTYSFTADPTKGFVRLKTSKKLGEPFAYTFNFDTKNGIVTISDDVNVEDNSPGSDTTAKSSSGSGQPNRIVMQSADNMIMLNNAEKTSVRLAGENLYAYAPQTVQISAGGQLILDAPLTTVNLDQKGIIVINGEAVGMNAESFVMDVSRVGINGSLKIMQTLVTNIIRNSMFVHGDVGEAYTGPTINNTALTGVENTGDPDTETDAAAGRTVAAWTQVNAAIEALATAIHEVASAVPTSVDTTAATTAAEASQVKTIVGEG